jgi:hypothetical protein
MPRGVSRSKHPELYGNAGNINKSMKGVKRGPGGTGRKQGNDVGGVATNRLNFNEVSFQDIHVLADARSKIDDAATGGRIDRLITILTDKLINLHEPPRQSPLVAQSGQRTEAIVEKSNSQPAPAWNPPPVAPGVSSPTA